MPIRLLSGDNHLEIDDALHAIRGAFDQIGVLTFDGLNVPFPSLSEACRTAGLFDPERLVIVNGLHLRLKGAHKESEAEQIRELLGSIVPTTTIVLVEKDMPADHALVADVRAAGGQMRHFATPKARELPAWLRQRSVSLGVSMEPAAAELLAELVGTNPLQLESEIGKLATFAGPGQRVTPMMVETLVGAASQDTIFSLVDAIAGRDAARALDLMRRHMESAGNPIEFAMYLVRMLARQVRILLRIRLAQDAGRSRGDIVTQLRLPRYFADRYFRQASQLSTERLRGTFEQLAALEHRLKSGRAEPGSALDLLVAEMCG